MGELADTHDAMWRRATPYIGVRSNDAHTIYAYGIAQALVELHPEADPEVVLPAILLHDTGWLGVPTHDVLSAILGEVGHEVSRTAEILTIIDRHDSREEALFTNDALVKDADQLWRLTPHRIDTVMEWFGLTRDQAHLLVASRLHDHLFTDAARTTARILAAVAWVYTSPQRPALG